jgi:hypothetical protein
VRTTRGLKPSQTATRDQRREVHGHAAFRMVAQRYQPLRWRILSRSPTLRLAPASGAPGPMTGGLSVVIRKAIGLIAWVIRAPGGRHCGNSAQSRTGADLAFDLLWAG